MIGTCFSEVSRELFHENYWIIDTFYRKYKILQTTVHQMLLINKTCLEM